MQTPKPRTAGARLAALFAHGGQPEAETVAAARRDLAEAKIAQAITDALAVSPRLTDDQRERLTRLLVSGGAK